MQRFFKITQIQYSFLNILKIYKKVFAVMIFFLLPPSYVQSQQNLWFFLTTFWEVNGNGMAFNIEAFDMNKDSKLDVVLGNWNDTYVYYGGQGILDEQKDLTYTGRMLAICDYNGDGYYDMVAMHFTGFDSTRFDYDGEILFYWGSNNSGIAIDTIADYSIPLPTLYPHFEKFTVGAYSVGIRKGDLNGDGKSDLAFSAEYVNFSTVGALYIYMGKETPSDSADFILHGSRSRSYLSQFFDIGNINGDQYDDLLFSSNHARTVGIAQDSINYLHIFYGSENFNPVLGEESARYASFVNPDDSTAGWFIRVFSVDDINGDVIDDVVIGRSSYSFPHQSTVHYGSSSGIDTIPSYTFIQDTTTDMFFSAGGISQDIGDFNNDGYDDIIMYPSGYQIFTLHLCGPYVNNKNRYGAKGFSDGSSIIPQNAVNMGDQNNDGVKDVAFITYTGYAFIFYGLNIPTGVVEVIPVPAEFNLLQNYPNPFNPSTQITFALPKASMVELKVFDILGQEISTLIKEEKSTSIYKINFNASNLPSGVYFYRLQAGDFVQTKKMILLK